MRETILEPLVDLLGLLVYTVLSTGLAAGGLAVERLGAAELGANHASLGLWLVFVGAIALFAGGYLGYDKLLPRLLSG